ncbi:hypothetical protein KC19_10G027400 [Ceratodon purpureus]|uniref:Uncharacterized protein n=1 Tax=Ceratodon purpureus TaxID=3225 RepID=A0A8T0GIQ6_CERPU|nr:hypothetical protein KC19_10G027400 [Ceratodon purpureus]
MAPTSRALGLILFTLVVCQVATARPLSADPTPRERVQQAFKEITTLSDNLRIATLKITIFNAAQQGFVIAQGFTGIITKIAEYTAHIPDPSSNPSPFEDADAKLVVESLTTFVQVHQALLNVVIGKHGLLTLAPFFEPIRISLVSLEAVVDTFAFKLIAMIPTQKPAADDQFGKLSVTVSKAIDTYKTPFSSGATLSADPTPRERVQQAFKEITTLSDNLRIATLKINIFNAGQQGFVIAQGFTGIITKIAEYTAHIPDPSSNPSPFDDADAKLVVESLTTFVQVHQALLNVVIGKHGLLTLAPFFEPIRIALVSLEAVVDTFAFKLIAMIPTQKPAADNQFGKLSETVSKAIDTYKTPFNSGAILSADPSPRERVQQAFKEITTLSDNLRMATLKINIFNAGQQGFVIAQGFTGIITKIAEYTAHIPDPSSNPSPFDDADAKLVVESLTTFVQVHQALLNVVIGKHGLLTLVPFFEPIRISLVSLEAVVDTFAYKLIAMIPTQKPAATKQFDSLGVTVQLAINTYETPFIQLSSSK